MQIYQGNVSLTSKITRTFKTECSWGFIQIAFQIPGSKLHLTKAYITLPFNFTLIFCHFILQQRTMSLYESNLNTIVVTNLFHVNFKGNFPLLCVILIVDGSRIFSHHFFFGDGWQTSITDLVKAKHVHRRVICGPDISWVAWEGLCRLGSEHYQRPRELKQRHDYEILI